MLKSHYSKKLTQKNSQLQNPKKLYVMNALDLFLTAPNAENLKKIQNNSWMLTRVFQKDEPLARQFFKFEEWFQICKDLSGLTEEEKTTFKDLLKSSVSTFDEAIKYYHTLGYEDRIAWQKDFIGHAKTVKDCQYLLYSMHKGHRKEIVEKMQKVAVSDEDKKIAFSYKP